MKQIIAILLLLAISLTGAFYLKAQDNKDSLSPAWGTNGHIVTITYSSDTFLIADETTLNYGKSVAVIHTTNKSVFDDIYKTHNSLFKKYTIKWEKDGKERIKHYRIYLDNMDAEVIYIWSKTKL